MQYQSTRNRNLKATSTDAVLRGIAPDGGLYISDDLLNIQFDWKKVLDMDMFHMAAEILGTLLPEFPDMESLIQRSYSGKFESDELTPTVAVGDRYVLELFRGPTSAFKDVALSVLPQLIVSARAVNGVKEETVILTATSGDTGKAALEGFHDVKGTKIIVFYPDGGVSAVQKAQMATQKGNNVCVCAVRGNFDDAQTGVKKIFAACADRDLGDAKLSSANSINIGRLAPQVVYYFKAYADLLKQGRIQCGDTVHYVVPTGNFGDILAGYIAKLLGLPVGTLVCASNANDVLTEFFTTGKYDKRRPFHKTTSPSMDILVSSNLERLLYLLTLDDHYVATLMNELNTQGYYQANEELLRKLQASFACGCASDEDAAKAIGDTFKQTGYVMDPHTAVAWHVADQFIRDQKDDAPVVVLSTASPYKFPVAVVTALGEEPVKDEFDVMEQLHAISGVPIPKNLAGLKEMKAIHKDVINPEEMLDYVLKKIAVKEW